MAVQLQKNLDRVRLKRVASKSKNGTLGGYLISSHPSGLLIATKQLYVLCSFIELRLLEFQDPYLMTHINLIRFLNLCMMLHQSSHRGLKLDGAIGQGKICNSLKSENFSKFFLSHIGKNKIKF